MIVQFSSPLVDGPFYIVTTPEDGKALMKDGIPRGRIWSRKEVETLGLIAKDPKVKAAAIELKMQFDARLQDVIEEGADGHVPRSTAGS